MNQINNTLVQLYCNHNYTRKYNLKVHIEKMHSEDNINTMTNLALPPLSHVSPPLIPPSYEQLQPSTCKDNASKMFYKCSYCEHETPYKGNLKTHVKKKHEKNINESVNHISMKNETLKDNQNYLRKIKMMLKENVLMDLDISTLRRNVDRLTQHNNNEFNLLAQHYEKIMNYSQDINLNSGDLFGSDEGDVEEEDEVENEYTLYERYI